MTYFAYALYNEKRDRIYIGHTNDLTGRVARHNKILKSKSTSFTSKNAGIWEIVHTEKLETRGAAIKREKELKSYRGREFIRGIISNNRP